MNDRQLWEINPYVRICVRTITNKEWKLTDRIIYDHQFVLVSKGKGEIYIENRRYQVKKGDLVLIYPGKIHGFLPDSIDPFVMEVVHFDFFYEKERNFWPHKKYHLQEGEDLTNIPEKEMMREHPVFEKAINFPEYLSLKNYTTAEVLMKKMISMNTEMLTGREILIKSIFLEFLYLVYQEEMKSKEKCANDGFEQIKVALEYMNEHYSEKISIKTLADLCSLSINYFSTLFKRHTTISPKKYLIKLRLEKAKELLVQSQATITEICIQTGFRDIHYFSQYFKCQEGYSPSAYRIMIKKKEEA